MQYTGPTSTTSLPSHLGLLTVASVTLSETNRMAAARRWLGATATISDRETFLLEGFWKLLDECPPSKPITAIRARHVKYT